MKRLKNRRIAVPPNAAAKALSENQFKLKIVKNKRDYSRKTKHKKGHLDHHQSVPFLLAV